MGKYLVDTNIIIYYLNGEATAIEWLQSHQEKLSISVITKIEVLSYPFQKDEEILIQQFLNQFELIHLSDEIIDSTIKLRRQRKIKTPDAVIAATALISKLSVCTKNIRDFKNIEVDYLNPFEGMDSSQ